MSLDKWVLQLQQECDPKPAVFEYEHKVWEPSTPEPTLWTVLFPLIVKAFVIKQPEHVYWFGPNSPLRYKKWT
jgi:hypothetical protein